MTKIARDAGIFILSYMVGLFLAGLLAKIAWTILTAGWNVIS